MAKLTDKQIADTKKDKTMNAVIKYGAYFRANIHRFPEEYLGIHLKLFQKILLYAMDKADMFYYIAARGQGKTFLVALYACCRAILYPHTKCVICSFTFKQGKQVVSKITDDFMHRSPLLVAEILKVTTGQNDCYVYFKNGSWIKVVVAGESSLGARSNLLIIDEARLIPQKIVDTILRPFNASPRQIGYMDKPEYAGMQEMNKEIYMSSAWYAQSEMYEKVKTFFANMLDPNLNYIVVDLPYQLSIKEGLLMREQIANEMAEATFSDVTFSMEREGLFYGSATDALFEYNTLNSRRKIVDSFHSLDYYRQMHLKTPDKQEGELRILSLDIALMASKKHRNDASCFIIHSAIPTASNTYTDNLVFIDTEEGLVTDDLGLLTMRYFYQYNCDYIAIDCNGVGAGVVDYIMADRYDPLYNQGYPALSCMNNPEIAERCKTRNAPKVIYAIKANAKSNNDMVLSLRAGFQNGYINLLINDVDSENTVTKIRGFKGLPESIQTQLRMPYVQTTMLINEMINLDHDTSGGMVRVKEKPNMRKDRFSSCEYGWALVQELSRQLKPVTEDMKTIVQKMYMRKGKIKR